MQNLCANWRCRDSYRNNHVSRVRTGVGHTRGANGPASAGEANPTAVNPPSQSCKADGPRSTGRGRRQGIRPQSPSITLSHGKNSTSPRPKHSRVPKRRRGQMVGQGLVEYALILTLVTVVIIVIIALVGPYLNPSSFHGKVLDKQIVPPNGANPEFIVTVLVDDKKQVYETATGMIYSLITVGSECDFKAYGSLHNTQVIKEAVCK